MRESLSRQYLRIFDEISLRFCYNVDTYKYGGRMRMYRPIDMKKTGLQIKKMLSEGGYDVKYIQSYLHLSCPQSIYRWFKGKRLPSVEHLSALSELLHVSMNELLVLQGSSEIYKCDLEQYDSKYGRLLAYETVLRVAA